MTTRKVVCTSQPQGAVSIDWSNPLNKGLAFALASGGDIDAVSQIKATASASSKKGVSSAGVGVAGTGMALGSEHVSFGNAGADVFKAAGTLHVLLTISGNVGIVNRLGVASKTANSTFGWALTLIYGAPEFELYGSASDLHILSNQTLQNGKTYLVSVTIPSSLPVASGAHIYVNAVDTTTGSPSGTGTSGTDASVLMKVGGGGNSTNDFMGVISYVSLVRREQSSEEIRAVAANPWQIFQKVLPPIFTSVAPAAAQIDKTLATFFAVASASAQTAQIDKSLIASVAPASATGPTAVVSKTTVVFCTAAPSVAAGVTCSLSGGVSISCASAQAAATAPTAQIDLSINGSVSQASAVGVTARTNKSLLLGLAQATALGTTARRNDGLACGVGAATAQGVTCATNGAATITCSVGDSAAAAPSAQVDKSLLAGVGSGAALGIGTLLDKSTLTLVAPASARGTTAYADISVITVAAPASAAGITIPVSGAVTITTIAASASANGVTENISTGTSCSVANAGAAGVTAVLQTGVVISASVAAAIAAGITSQIDKAINAAATSAFAAGVTASIVVPGNETIGCSRALASAKGVTSIVSFTIIITFDVENIQLVSDLCLSSSSLSPISKSVVFQSKLIN